MKNKPSQLSKIEDQLEKNKRLSKRLCYLLRYGAAKEGLSVYDGGYVELDQLLKLEIMKKNEEAEVLALIETSTSHRGGNRFEKKEAHGKTLVRSIFYRNIEKNPCHDGTGVHNLLEQCLQRVTSNLQSYDLQDFPDEHLISMMIHKLKREKKMNSTNLRHLLVPTLEHLNLEGIYITEGMIKTMWTMCPNLRVLSLMGSGYVMTDNVMEHMLKKLQNLESLNLCGCNHLTDKTVHAIITHGNMKQLNLTNTPHISELAVLNLIISCTQLTHLDIFDKRISPEGRRTIVEHAKKKITIVLKGLSDKDVAPENPCAMFPNFGKIL